MAKESLTQSELKKLLHYDPETGIFTYLVRTNPNNHVGMIAGCLIKAGYLIIAINNTLYGIHRLAFLYMIGRFPKNEVDHINHISSDNRWVNLREATSSENNKNASRRKLNNSGITGVHWCNGRKKWSAQIGVNKKVLNLGRYEDFFEACCARKSAEVKYGFHPNHGL